MNRTRAAGLSLQTQASAFLEEEHFDSVAYSMLAALERDEGRRALLERLATTEHEHAAFWAGIAQRQPSKVNPLRLWLLKLLRRLAGLTFTMKFLELHEQRVIERYREILPSLDPSLQQQLQDILRDEEEHERTFMAQVDDAAVRYIGFVALGLSDAIIEITGVHAGFLGVMGSTLVAGIAGLVVGFAASISMGVAAYLKAKSETRHSPLASALITSVSYLASVVLLAAPYFLTESMLAAFGVSVVLAVSISVGFTFYVSVVNETNFWREAVENTLLLLGTAVATYLFGELLGAIFGVRRGMY